MTNRALAGTENSAIFVSALSSLLMRKELCKVPAVHFKTTVIRHTIYIVKNLSLRSFLEKFGKAKIRRQFCICFAEISFPIAPLVQCCSGLFDTRKHFGIF